MRGRHQHRFTFGSIAVVVTAAGVAAQQSSVSPTASPLAGLLRSELSLGGRTATVAYASPADEATRRGAVGGAVPGVRVAQLVTNASLTIGDVAVGRRDPGGVRYELWLEAPEGSGGKWELRLVEAAQADAQPAVVGRVPLDGGRVGSSEAPFQRQGSGGSGFVAALVPETESTARLVMRWESYEAAVPVAFTDPPVRRRTAETTPPNVPVNRAHDEDTSALSRARMLAQRNETALVLPTGERFSVSFQRTFGKDERPSASGSRTRGLAVDGPDFARLASTTDGAVVLLTQAAVPRLSIEKPLRFGRTVVPTGNQVPGFPGSYGLWLKRSGRGWRLVFNHEPDAWGSQHDPNFDAADIPLTYSDEGSASRPFAVGLAPTASGRGRLVIVWGVHEWSADFLVAD